MDGDADAAVLMMGWLQWMSDPPSRERRTHEITCCASFPTNAFPVKVNNIKTFRPITTLTVSRRPLSAEMLIGVAYGNKTSR